MLDVRRGDQGPRVALLQTLLNLTGGEKLVVDGIFGRHTASAVRSARGRLLQSRGDAAIWGTRAVLGAAIAAEPPRHLTLTKSPIHRDQNHG
jgi:peptidoglycan hydrolase-like protein with peptidoglycan-binding domain